MQARKSVGYESDLRALQITLPPEAGSGGSLSEVSTPIAERGPQPEIPP
jgi:hypothetical protein